MTVYMVSYNLFDINDYADLWRELKRLGAFRAQECCWLVNVDMSAKRLHGQLTSVADPDDRIWVMELTGNRCYSNAKRGTIEWLLENPTSR